MSYIEHIQRCNRFSVEALHPFLINGERFGYVQPWLVQQLVEFTDVFSLTGRQLILSDRLNSAEDRTAAVAEILSFLRKKGEFKHWNDELFPIKNHFSEQSVMSIQRAAIASFGARAYGVHVNGLVETDSGSKLWVATRSRAKTTFPGMLDHIVAGGQPAGLGLLENVIKEAEEEASIPPVIAAQATLETEITYCASSANGLKPDTLFCFDLILPETFVPASNDGEVESFQLMSLQEVAEIVATTEQFKPNCNLVIIDLLIRKGLITDKTGALAASLHRELP